ncbi:DUF342 domain-containing protein [Ectothiorhodospiraceae bacterium BW-2]|nr:DUF342 domain-containing protein [Ectothiorhodospiraceae bacterium BW-2]
MLQQKAPTTEPVVVTLGKLALKANLLTREQLSELLRQVKREWQQGGQISAKKLFLVSGLLEKEQFDHLVATYKMRQLRQEGKQLGALALELKMIKPDQLQQALTLQKQLFQRDHQALPLGKILEKKGFVTPAQLQQLVEQRQLTQPAAEESADEQAAQELTFAIVPSKDGSQCLLKLYSPYRGEDGVALLHTMLHKARITFGLVGDDTLARLLAGEKGEEGSWVIAKGRPPERGVDGKVVYQFDTDPLKIGKVKQGGQIDFKDRGEIPHIEAGSVLATITPPVPGKPGMTIFGKEIAPPKLKQPKVNCGKGAKLGADKLTVIASVRGTPSLNATRVLSVSQVHQIKGDVGYKSGHVEFEGDIEVKGVIHDGFKVKGNRLITKEINAADIEISGDILVQGGIIGGKIRCGGHLRAHFIHNAELEVNGDVLVDKEVFESTIHCGGAFLGERVTLFNSTLSTCGNMVVKDVGSEDGASPNHLYLGTCIRIQQEIEQRQQQLKRLQQQQQQDEMEIVALEQERQQMSDQITEFAQIQDLSQVEIRPLQEHLKQFADKQIMEARKLQQDITALQQKISTAEEELNRQFERQEAIDTEIPELQQRLASLRDEQALLEGELEVLQQQREAHGVEALIDLKGTMNIDTELTGLHASLKLERPLKRLKIRHHRVGDKEQGYRWVIDWE